LQDIPQFLPILRSALKGSSFLSRSRDDAHSLEKMDNAPLLRISRITQEFLTHAALVTGSEQNRLHARMREVISFLNHDLTPHFFLETID
jgi:hypothetical protein